MLLRNDDEIDSASYNESEDNDSMPSLEYIDEEHEYVIQGKSLVIRRALNIQVKDKDD